MIYKFKAKILDIHDGDTFKASIMLRRTRARDADFGFHVHIDSGWVTMHTNIRLLGLNCNEINTDAGKKAKAYVEHHMPVGSIVTLETSRADGHPDKYGDRWLARVTLPDDRSLNDLLVLNGHARDWDGQGVKPV